MAKIYIDKICMVNECDMFSLSFMGMHGGHVEFDHEYFIYIYIMRLFIFVLGVLDFQGMYCACMATSIFFY